MFSYEFHGFQGGFLMIEIKWDDDTTVCTYLLYQCECEERNKNHLKYNKDLFDCNDFLLLLIRSNQKGDKNNV